MKCPVCDSEMTNTEFDGVPMDRCPRCRGVWLDRGRLEDIVAGAESRRLRDGRRYEDDRDDEDDLDEDDRDQFARRERKGRDSRVRANGADEDMRGGSGRREGFFRNVLDMFGGD